MRLYSFAQKAMYGGTTLQPLANEGYFPDKFAKLNKEGLPIAASKLNLIITISSATLWLIVPDIIKGI
jgi:amino acid permease